MHKEELWFHFNYIIKNVSIKNNNMNIGAIVSEYNPFHNGHKYHLEQTRNIGVTHLIAIMSGNFIQRGSASMFSKYAKAKMALMSGIDLVIELPIIWSTASAEKFAYGAVTLANSLGCINYLSFGSECGDINKLKKIASIMSNNTINNELKKNLNCGFNFAKSIQNALNSTQTPELANILNFPNNILGIEYIKSLYKTNSNISPITIKRKYGQHNSKNLSGKFTSASAIREQLLLNKNINSFIPNAVSKIIQEEINKGYAPANILNAERAIISKLRCMTKYNLRLLPNVNEGLENRLYNAIHLSTSIDELYSMVKTKRYHYSRIRRIILHAFLEIYDNLYSMQIPYIRILGFNNRGKEILKVAKQTAKLPIITKSTHISRLNDDAKNLFKLECLSADLYNILTPKVLPCGQEMTNKIVIV